MTKDQCSFPYISTAKEQKTSTCQKNCRRWLRHRVGGQPASERQRPQENLGCWIPEHGVARQVERDTRCLNHRRYGQVAIHRSRWVPSLIIGNDGKGAAQHAAHERKIFRGIGQKVGCLRRPISDAKDRDHPRECPIRMHIENISHIIDRPHVLPHLPGNRELSLGEGSGGIGGCVHLQRHVGGVENGHNIRLHRRCEADETHDADHESKHGHPP